MADPWAEFRAQPAAQADEWAAFRPAGVNTADDVVKSAGIGVVKGGLGLLGTPGDIRGLASAATDYIGKKAGFNPETVSTFKDNAYTAARANPMLAPFTGPGSAELTKQVEGQTGKFYEPKTVMGEYARTVGEFVPGAAIGPGGAIARGAQVVIPALASETAGQMTKGSSAEPWARGATALLSGGVTSLASRPGTASRALREAMPAGVTEQQVTAAERLMEDAARQGVQLAWPEALSQVAQRPVLTNTLRHLEATPQTEGRMAEFFGRRPQQVEGAARQQFDNVAPVNAQPSQIGQDASEVARGVVGASPEGRILADTLQQAGPRTSPGDAGAIIQSELRNVYDRREGMRSALAEQDYGAARAAGTPVPTGVVVNFIDRELQAAKGDTQRALQSARDTMFRPDGSLDTSVTGLHNARGAISDLIDTATRSGANNTARELQGTLQRLDAALESVPAYGQARQNFAAASRPLEPFGDTRAPGRIIERDQFNQRNVMAPEQAPGTIERGGGTAAQDFNAVATPAARNAFEQHIVTQVLDKATKEGADLSANAIRQALRQNEDLLRQYPGVADRLQSVAIAREGLERVMSGPLGQIAKRDTTTKKAVEALFPANPLPNSADEIANTVGALAQRSPRIARDLVRTHVEGAFNEAAQALQSGANQAGGAKFRTAIVGNKQQAENLEAAVRALPNGDQVWPGFNRFLDILEATGTRQNVGSRTAYNAEALKNSAASGMIGEGAKALANPLRGAAFIAERYERYRLGSNLGQLADILTNPGSANQLRAIARMPPGSTQAQTTVARMLAAAESSRSNSVSGANAQPGER